MDRLESESNVGNDDESTESARYLPRPVVICSRVLELDLCPTFVVSAYITLIRLILKLLYLKASNLRSVRASLSLVCFLRRYKKVWW